MQNFQGKVAVVTGAASGIGFGLVQRATAEGMRIADAGRNRPAHLSGTVGHAARPERAAMEAMGRAALAAGMAPAAVADIVFRAIRERRFWIFTDQDMCALAKVRFDGAFAGRNPARSAPV
jgi:NAD(P)-dependent dehydrogenase (short-subunit alcohol dehydrogenase family)